MRIDLENMHKCFFSAYFRRFILLVEEGLDHHLQLEKQQHLSSEEKRTGLKVLL